MASNRGAGRSASILSYFSIYTSIYPSDLVLYVVKIILWLKYSLTAVRYFINHESLERRKAGNTISGDPGGTCLLYTSPSPRDLSTSRMPSSA